MAITIGVAVLKQPHSICWPFFALVIVSTWLVRDNFFFWDTMQLAAQHALFFYNNDNFSTFLLPDNMDSGHPPTFGYYLAWVWKTFGKTLAVSHLAMLPFLLGIVWQAWKLGEKIVGEGWTLLFLLLLTVCPVVAGQGVLVSPDIVLLFFFLMALNGIFSLDADVRKTLKVFRTFNGQLAIAILGLAAISMRGMMVIAALFIFYCLINVNYFKSFIINVELNFKSLINNLKTNELISNNNELTINKNELINNENDLAINKNELIINKSEADTPKFNFKLVCFVPRNDFFNSKHPLSIKALFSLFLPFLMGILLAFSFLMYHFMHKGWIGFHAGSPWSPAFERVDVMDFIKNVAVLIWRLIDFGHLFLWLIIIYGLIKLNKLFPTTRLLIALLITLLIVLTPTLLIYKSLLAHRYLMPVYVVLILLTTKIISDLKNYKRQLMAAFIAFTGLLSGNFWVYPQPISTGWDATLAHLPYYELRREMLQFIDNQHINYTDIGTAFPNQRDFETTDLKTDLKADLKANLKADLKNSEKEVPSVFLLNDKRKNTFSTYDFDKNRYIFYSNLMNDFNEAELNELKTHWHRIKSLKKGQVEVILFKKNE